MGTTLSRLSKDRSQVGIGTLAVFIAMVLVALIAGGVLIETTGLLQGKSAATGQQSSDRVTDRVGVESATASYSSGNMQRIDIVLSKEPGSGDIDLSEMVVHWLGPNGSTELTDSTFSVTPVKGSGTVLEARSNRMNVSNFGKTIPDGTPATVRFITPDGGTTTVILRTPNAPPSDGAASLLWKSPSGNPASGSGTATATVTTTATATPTPTPYSKFEWNYSDADVSDLAVSDSVLFARSRTLSEELHELDATDGSVTTQTQLDDTLNNGVVDNQDRYLLSNTTEDLVRWDPASDTTSTTTYQHPDVSQTNALDTYSGDIYLSQEMDDDTGEIERRQSDGSLVWEKQLSDRAYTPILATDSALYTAMVRDTLKKRDHSNGDVQWSNEIVDSDSIDAVHAGSGDYLYVGTQGALHQLYKSNGTETSFSFQYSGDVDSIDTDDQGFIYLADDQNFTVVDPSDESVVLRRTFSDYTSLAVRPDGVYVLVWKKKVSKLTIHNLP